jgi:NADH:ubiquinone oxidoreductase subunit 4 (subunit M)
MGGLWAVVPRVSGAALFFGLASLGPPGLAISSEISSASLALSTTCVSSVALYSAPPELALIRTISKSGVFVVVALSILLIWFGVYPRPLFKRVRTTVVGRNTPRLRKSNSIR